MPTSTSDQIFHAFQPQILAGIIGFIGTLITVSATWAKDRNRDAKIIQIIDLATKYMAFWDQQVKALDAAGAI